MSATNAQEFFSRYFPPAEVQVIAEWDVPIATVHRLIAGAEELEAAVNLPIDESRCLEFKQAFLLAHVKHRGEAEIMVTPYQNRAAYRVSLVKRRAKA